jgi:uncharacterized protein (TIGR02646 family)
MIPIDRLQVEMPAVLGQSETWGDELCELRRAWHAGGKIGDRPEALSSRYRHETVKTALEEVIGKKCWYCEDGARRYDIEHFRPQSIYPILAYRWGNLLLSCQICNQNYKKNQFPLLPDGIMALEDSENPKLCDDSDDAMLINPCQDRTPDHLTFREGRILGITQRGRTTIRICGLKDPDLQEERVNRAKLVIGVIAALKYAEREGNEAEIAKQRSTLRAVSQNRARFAGMVRAELSRRGYDWAAL